MECKVAVLLATYNGAEYLEAQLESILAQVSVDLHVYVRDDGSTDSTSQIVERYLSNSRITLLPTITPARSAAGNFFAILCAVPLQEHDYFAFADQDDVWDPEKLIKAALCLKQSGAGGYSSDLVSYSNDTGVASYLKKSYASVAHDHIFQGASAGCTYLFTRAVAEKVVERLAKQPSDVFLKRSHDWLVYSIARSCGFDWYYHAYASVFYRQHAANVYGSRSSWAGAIQKMQLIRSGWYRDNILWVANLSGTNDKDREVVRCVRENSFSSRWHLFRVVKSLRRKKSERIILSIFLLFGLF